MPGKKRRGSKKGGPESAPVEPAHVAQQRGNGVPTFSAGRSPPYRFKTSKRVSTKKKTSVKDIAQRRKKK